MSHSACLVVDDSAAPQLMFHVQKVDGVLFRLLGASIHPRGLYCSPRTRALCHTAMNSTCPRAPVSGAPLRRHKQDLELRLFARRHAFAGYTRVALVCPASSATNSALPSGSCSSDTAGREGGGVGGVGRRRGDGGGLIATRHHAIDWNYVGLPRPRPNKWRIEMGPGGDNWKEWGFAKVRVSLG